MQCGLQSTENQHTKFSCSLLKEIWKNPRQTTLFLIILVISSKGRILLTVGSCIKQLGAIPSENTGVWDGMVDLPYNSSYM